MKNQLDNFFYPRSVCVAGASTKEKSIGYEILKTILSYDYRGKIFPVNPKAESVLGLKCYPSVNDIDENIDLAVVVVPKTFTEATIDDLLTRGVKSIILITAGFRETGEEGAEVERRIAEKIKNAGARMAGPNCMGVISTASDIQLNATFVAEKPVRGKTGFLSQSGALGAAVLNSLRDTDIRFSHFISVGNKADINENDILRYWQDDSNTEILTFYLESFSDGSEFIKPFLAGTLTKPAIVLKSGRTSGGMKAASSHTGALGSSDRVVNSLLNQFGIIRANNVNQLFNTAKGFEFFKIPGGNRVAVVTNAGGPAILTVDSLEPNGLTPAVLSESTRAKLKEIVHPEGSINNPVDLLPGGNADIYSRVVSLLAEDSGVDAVISVFVEPVMVSPLPVVEAVYNTPSAKPVFQVVMPLPEFRNEYRENSVSGKPWFTNPEDPAKVIADMLFYQQSREKISAYKTTYKEMFTLKPATKKYSTGQLAANEINELAGLYNLPVIREKIITPDQIKDPGDLPYPVVIKAGGAALVHKSDFNAVRLDIKNREELISASESIISSLKTHNITPEYFLIQPYINARHEILIGGFRDPAFGPVIMFGTGGKYVEVYNDTALASCYLCDADIENLINSTAMGKILKGVRGDKAYETEGIKSVIKNCSKMMIENPGIAEFDINPLLIDKEGKIYAVDIRVKTAHL